MPRDMNMTYPSPIDEEADSEEEQAEARDSLADGGAPAFLSDQANRHADIDQCQGIDINIDLETDQSDQPGA